MANLFYRNRRLSVLFVGVVVVAGISSYRVLPRLEDPELTNRFASVKTLFRGADAERVESLVTERIEEEIREIEEIKLLESTSQVGISLIAIELRDDVDEVEEVWSRVRDKLDDATVLLPAGVVEPELEVTEVGAFARIVALCWTQDDRPNYAILRRQAEEAEQILRAIPGTEKVEVFGEPDEEIVVEVEQDRLAAVGLTVGEVARQLQASDAKIAAGQFRSASDTLLMELDSELDTLDRIRQTPIRNANGGRFVPLANIAQVEKGVKTPPDDFALVSGYPAVVVAVRIQADRRIDQWAAQARTGLDEFAAQLPRGVELRTVFEQDQYVDLRMRGLLKNLLFGAGAVLLVMLAIMGWQSALIVGGSLLLASLTVLAGLRMLGIPIHQMSATGLIIALGLLIDNAIVMVDEVRQRLRHGSSPADAVSQSVRHLAVPLFGSSLTTALAFAPIALMPGPAGEFVGSIAVSVILAIFASLILSLTVVAAAAAMGSRVTPSASGVWWQNGVTLPRLRRIYEASLAKVLTRPAWGIGLGMCIPVVGFGTFATLTEQFFPPEERNQFHIELELPAHASLDQTLETIRLARDEVMARDDVTAVDWFLGESAPPFYYNVIPKRENSSQYAQAIVTTRIGLKDRALLNELQHELDAAFPQSRLLVRQLEQGPPFDAPVEVRVAGPDLDRLRELGEEVRSILAGIDDVIHTTADLAETTPKLAVSVDEEQARLARLDHESISRQLDSTLEGTLGGSILETTEELPVRVRLSDVDRGDLSRIASLDLLPAVAASGQRSAIPLGALADFELLPEVAAIPHRDGSRVNEIKGYITAGVLPAKVLGELERRLAKSDFTLPHGYELSFGGEAAERDAAVGNLMASVAPLLVVMVAALVLSFSSFRMAAIIGAVGLLSVGLGLAMLRLFGFPFGFMAIIGTMGLVGVAINDSIVVLAAVREDGPARAGDPVALRRVVLRSTRHVVATTITTMAGFAPLVIWGGAFWAPLAITIAGGVTGATLLALYFTPSAYLLVMCRGRCPIGLIETADREVVKRPTGELPRDCKRHNAPALGDSQMRAAMTATAR